MEQRLLDKDEVAEMLHTNPRHVLDLSRAGKLRSIRVGRLVRFTLQDIKDFIENQRKQRLPAGA